MASMELLKRFHFIATATTVQVIGESCGDAICKSLRNSYLACD